MKVMRAASDAKFVCGGRTMTGWHDCCWIPDSKVWKSSEKNVLQPLSTSLCALIFLPSATIVQSDRCDWSNNCGNVLSNDVYGNQIKEKEDFDLVTHSLFFVFYIFKIGIWGKTVLIICRTFLDRQKINPFLFEIGVNRECKAWE